MSVTVTDWPPDIARGVVEGFYGNPWSHEDRQDLFRFYGDNKMNIHIYGPKNDPYHHSRWYELYPRKKPPNGRTRETRIGKQSQVRMGHA